MRLQEIKEVARRFEIPSSGMKKGDLIRAIQRAEGNEQCFGAGLRRECGQDRCAWRQDCD